MKMIMCFSFEVNEVDLESAKEKVKTLAIGYWKEKEKKKKSNNLKPSLKPIFGTIPNRLPWAFCV